MWGRSWSARGGLPGWGAPWGPSFLLLGSLLLRVITPARPRAAQSASPPSVATRLESTPPLNPRTTRSKPTLRTSLRMKPTRIRRTSSGLIRSGGKAGSVRLAGAFMPDSSQFVDGKFHPFIPQHRVRQALSAHLPEVETGDDQRL